MVDELNDGLHRLDGKGRANAPLIRSRKDIRHMISELVHQTDSEGSGERIPHILEAGAFLKRQIAAEQNR